VRPGPDDAAADVPSGSVALLTAYVTFVVAIPSRLIFAPLGGAGTPAEMLGLAMFVLWLFRRIASPRVSRIRSTLRIAMALFCIAMLTSYVAAATRPISPVELTAADRGLVSVLSWLGAFLFAADMIVTREALDVLLRRLSVGAGALAALGLAQFATGLAFTNYLQIPGLSINGDLVSIASRGSLARPAGTAIHPIEFGAVLTMVLPIALHYALADRHRPLLARWFPVAMIAFAVPISISRSAIVSAAVVLAFMLPIWPKDLRRKAYVAIGLVVMCCYVLVPGLVGTIIGLFTGVSGDASTKSRTDSYALAWDLLRRAPVFGRGFRTFLPAYRIFDNQYLGTAIETGAVGLVMLLAILGTGVARARAVRRRSDDPNTRQLGQAMAAAIAATGISFALFDGLSFPMVTSLLFLVLGCVAALDRLVAVPVVSIQRSRPSAA